MGTVVTNPSCRTTQRIPVTFTNVKFVNCDTNIGVGCPLCGADFDAAPGGDGTYSTVGGRIQRMATGVRTLLAESRSDPVLHNLLIGVLQQHRDVPISPSRLAEEIGLATSGGYGGFRQWLQENEWVAGWVGAGGQLAGILLMIIMYFAQSSPDRPDPAQPSSPPSVVVNVHTPTDAEIRQRIEEALTAAGVETGDSSARSYPRSERRTGRAPARNVPCPCGSGAKYKRCHGAASVR